PTRATGRRCRGALAALEPTAGVTWAGRTESLRAAYRGFLAPVNMPGAVKLAEVVRISSALLPDDAFVVNGAGNYAAFLHRHFEYKAYRTQLAPTSGSMGYGLPAAIAAKVAHPARVVVNLQAACCFRMTGQELATAVQYGLAIITIVANNGMYGTIRMHQEREFPRRVVGTTLITPDFAAYARSFGAEGYTIETTADFAPALSSPLASNRPAVIQLR